MTAGEIVIALIGFGFGLALIIAGVRIIHRESRQSRKPHHKERDDR